MIYTPDAGHTRSDSFQYAIRDGAGRTDTATVTVTVSNPARVAGADTVATEAGKAVLVMVLANDSGSRGHALTVTAVANPPNGTATVSGDRKSITYRPDSEFSGSDAFDYTVNDGRGGTAQGSVVVTVRKGSGPAEPIYVGSDTTPYHDDSCDNETLGGTLYRDAEVGPWLAADPTNANNLIAVWQQDRFSNGGSRGDAGAYSTDGGATRNGFTLPMLTLCTPMPRPNLKLHLRLMRQRIQPADKRLPGKSRVNPSTKRRTMRRRLKSLGIDAATTTKLSAHDSPRRLIASFPAKQLMAELARNRNGRASPLLSPLTTLGGRLAGCVWLAGTSASLST